MSDDNLVLRTVYVDPDVDDQLRDEAEAHHVSKADLFRAYLTTGMKAAHSKPELLNVVALQKVAPTLVLRTVHMDPKVDSKLRIEAFDSNTSKNDLMRRYVRVGMHQSKPAAKAVSRAGRATARKKGALHMVDRVAQEVI